MDKKRVLLLLRDSTLKQDISMQRIACRQFVELHPDWEIVDEITEEGVSGFKKSAKQRDGLQQAQERAVNGEYDILLVYMFDRIGRRESESPFVVKWFVLNGVEVWSTQEGQQKFENHTDNLINFLRFWQAEGESLKISTRTRTKSGQMVTEGRYRGGPIPFGYRIEKQGRINKKGYEVHEIVINDEEAEVVRLIYQKYAYEGMGTRRIAKYLNENGYRPRDKTHIWVNTSIQRILRNIVYLGILKSGETISDVFVHLQIVDINLFDQVQKAMDERKERHNNPDNVPLTTKSKSLLSGNLFCGHCGLRMVQSSSTRRRERKDGSIYESIRHYYRCYGKTRFKECNGATTYMVSTIDDCVEAVIRNLLQQVKSIPSTTVLKELAGKQHQVLKRQCECARQAAAKKEQDLSKLENELVLVLSGESVFDKETLGRVIKTAQNELDGLRAQLEHACGELEREEEYRRGIQENYNQMITWTDLYDSANHNEKKVILCHLIKRVEVFSSKEIKVELNVSYNDLFFGLIGEEIEDVLNLA